MPGELIVVSAPSGAGKTSVIKGLMQCLDGLTFSISHTTRPARENERDGRDYHFIDRNEFLKRVDRGFFLEWAEVHDHLYGTSIEEVEKDLAQNLDVLLDIDVQGADQIRRTYPGSVHVLIIPPSYEELEKRLNDRHQDCPETIHLRLNNARQELAQYVYYDYVIMNDELSQAIEDLKTIILTRRLRTERLKCLVESILSTFPQQEV